MRTPAPTSRSAVTTGCRSSPPCRRKPEASSPCRFPCSCARSSRDRCASCFQVAVLRRMQPTTKNQFLRPVFLWADEAQNFITEFDAEYQAVARSAAGCTVYLVQNRESMLRVLGNASAVDSLLGNLQCKVLCQNSSPDTNEWAAKLLGERWITVTGTNVGRGAEGAASSGVNRSEQRRYFVEPARFTTLKRGGEKHGRQVQAIVYLGGHEFPNIEGGREEKLPYTLLTFNRSEEHTSELQSPMY